MHYQQINQTREDVSHILQNSGCKEGGKGGKLAQFPTNKFHCCITNPLQVTWTNSAHSNLCSAGADENSGSTEKNGRRKKVCAEGTGERAVHVWGIAATAYQEL